MHQLHTEASRRHHDAARIVLPMGVTGDGRYVDPYPIVFARGEGKWLTDVDGSSYLDLHGGFGTAILGYANPEVDAAVIDGIRDVGAFVGLPHVYEERLAKRLCDALPACEMVALCGGGGSDAIYHSIRIARAATGRWKIVKLEGSYHGWHADVGVSTHPDLLTAPPVGVATGVPNSLGSLPAALAEVIVVEANDQDALSQVFDEHGDEIAALVMEPVLFSLGCVQLDYDFVADARRLCSRYNAVLIFDEIMSGFRTTNSGSSGPSDIEPDLAVFGKAIANGYMISAVTGSKELVGSLTPQGNVFYSGTFNGHPISCIAALATLEILDRDDIAAHVTALTGEISRGINGIIGDLDLNAVCQSHGSVWALYFNARQIRNWRDIVRATDRRFSQMNDDFRTHLADHGLFMQKRRVNRAFVSAAYESSDVGRITEVVGEFLADNAGALSD